jgi:putative ABC transport system permease protein
MQEEERRSLAAISAFIDSQHTLADAGGAQRLESARVSSGFFELFGARPILGRTFVREENEPGSERVAVLSHALERRHFGGDTAVIGRTIALMGYGTP